MTHKNQNRWGSTKFMHFRNVNGDVIEGKGGATVAYVVGELGVTYATAFCCDKDNYNGHIGRTIATNRLAKGINEDFVGTKEEFIEVIGEEMIDLTRVFKS